MIPGLFRTSGFPINGTTFLEILWIGAHSYKIHDNFHDIKYPSTLELRVIGGFYVDFLAKSSNSAKEQQGLEMLNNFEAENKIQSIYSNLF